jgi:hypothetical protein
VILMVVVECWLYIYPNTSRFATTAGWQVDASCESQVSSLKSY